ncbi:unnamed protein product [Adineta steineri]|uniref:Beta-lactamase-related domain-containing protein n=1 Tax=Adineta steineri TaxID=433720 RepID=A0A819M7T2_9BILA|nr:unnamed protein product [Adineta steineri]
MSARTLSVYLRMFLNNGSNILSPRSIAEMRAVVGSGLIPYYKDANSTETGPPPPPTEFGLSWYWRTMSNGRRYIGHSGSLPGMVHLMLIDEKNSVGVIVLTNGDTNEPNGVSRGISQTLAEIHMSLFQCFETDVVNMSTTTTPTTSTNTLPTSTTLRSSCQKVQSSIFFITVILTFLF